MESSKCTTKRKTSQDCVTDINFPGTSFTTWYKQGHIMAGNKSLMENNSISNWATH